MTPEELAREAPAAPAQDDDPPIFCGHQDGWLGYTKDLKTEIARLRAELAEARHDRSFVRHLDAAKGATNGCG